MGTENKLEGLNFHAFDIQATHTITHGISESHGTYTAADRQQSVPYQRHPQFFICSNLFNLCNCISISLHILRGTWGPRVTVRMMPTAPSHHPATNRAALILSILLTRFLGNIQSEKKGWAASENQRLITFCSCCFIKISGKWKN